MAALGAPARRLRPTALRGSTRVAGPGHMTATTRLVASSMLVSNCVLLGVDFRDMDNHRLCNHDVISSTPPFFCLAGAIGCLTALGGDAGRLPPLGSELVALRTVTRVGRVRRSPRDGRAELTGGPPGGVRSRLLSHSFRVGPCEDRVWGRSGGLRVTAVCSGFASVRWDDVWALRLQSDRM